MRIEICSENGNVVDSIDTKDPCAEIIINLAVACGYSVKEVKSIPQELK